MSDEQRTGEQPPTPDEPGRRPMPPGPLEHGQVDDPWLLDRVLSDEAADEWSPVRELLAAATGPAELDELRGERAAVAAFQAARAAAAGRHDWQHVSSGGRGARRVAVVSTLMAGKFAAVTVAGIVTLGAGGMAAAAYTGLLPAPLQDVAHRTIGAPMPDRTALQASSPSTEPTTSPSPSTTTSTSTRTGTSDTSTTSASVVQQPVRPVTDLCTDWQQQQLATAGPAFAALTDAASGSTSIDAFCAALVSPTTQPTTTASVSPTSEPTATPSDSPTATTSGPATASDDPTGPPMTASDQPSVPVSPSSTATGTSANEPTGP